MRKKTRIISICLIFIFGVLVLKNLAPLSFDSGVDNCNEFGHIHFHIDYLKVSSLKKSVLKSSHRPGSHDQDENCHEGKSIFSYSLFPHRIYVITNPLIRISFQKVWVLQNPSPNPDLEPRRKPPKLAA